MTVIEKKKILNSLVRVQETKNKTYEQSYGSGLASWASYLLLICLLLFLVLVFPYYQCRSKVSVR